MRSTTERPENFQAARSFLRPMAAVCSVFLVTGAALPVIPRHIHDDLGFGVFVVGLVSGAQFVVALASRLWAGAVSDRRGPKFAVMTGLVMVAIAGTFYLCPWRFPTVHFLLSQSCSSDAQSSAAQRASSRSVRKVGQWGFFRLGTQGALLALSALPIAIWLKSHRPTGQARP